MNANILPSDRIALLGAIDPDAYSTGTYTTGWVDMSEVDNILAMVSAGTLGASATLDGKIQEAKDGSGTGSQDLTGKAITQLTKAGTDSDKQALINVRSDELSDGYTHARLSITVGTASSDAAGYVFGLDARYGPKAQASTVDETVS